MLAELRVAEAAAQRCAVGPGTEDRIWIPPSSAISSTRSPPMRTAPVRPARCPLAATETVTVEAPWPEPGLTPFGTPRYSVPRPSEAREKLTRVAAVLILAYWTYYIVWRWTSTLNFDALWFSIPLVLAETWGWATARG